MWQRCLCANVPLVSHLILLWPSPLTFPLQNLISSSPKYKVLTTILPSYLYNLISVQPHRSTRSSDIITLSHLPSSSSLKVNNRSFHHASPCLWNQFPYELRLPVDHEDLSLLSDLSDISSSFPISPLSPSITPSHFHSRLKTHLFHKSFPPQFYLSTYRSDSTDSRCFSFFSGMSVLTLALCARLSWLLHIKSWHIIIIIIIISLEKLISDN